MHSRCAFNWNPSSTNASRVVRSCGIVNIVDKRTNPDSGPPRGRPTSQTANSKSKSDPVFFRPTTLRREIWPHVRAWSGKRNSREWRFSSSGAVCLSRNGLPTVSIHIERKAPCSLFFRSPTLRGSDSQRESLVLVDSPTYLFTILLFLPSRFRFAFFCRLLDDFLRPPSVALSTGLNWHATTEERGRGEKHEPTLRTLGQSLLLIAWMA